MMPELDLPRALLRGRYMAAVARMEYLGIPIDIVTLSWMRKQWRTIQIELINRIDSEYHVFEGRTFKTEKWATWLAANGIPWPRLESGQLALDDRTFQEMARLYPALEPIRQLRYALSQMRLEDLAVGADGRNRCMLSAFSTKTSRNAPSNVRFIFGPAVWLRGLIHPLRGSGLAYLDWSQQEFAIGAYLSNDPNMIAAYESADPYLSFAKQAGRFPRMLPVKRMGRRERCSRPVRWESSTVWARTRSRGASASLRPTPENYFIFTAKHSPSSGAFRTQPCSTPC